MARSGSRRAPAAGIWIAGVAQSVRAKPLERLARMLANTPRAVAITARNGTSDPAIRWVRHFRGVHHMIGFWMVALFTELAGVGSARYFCDCWHNVC